MSIGSTAQEVIRIIEPAAVALEDDLLLWDVWISSTQYPSADPDLTPQPWQAALGELSSDQRRILSHAVGQWTPGGLNIETVGAIRQLPTSELLRVREIGESKAAVVKALGHYADKEVRLEDIAKPQLSSNMVLTYGGIEEARLAAIKQWLKP